MSAIYLATGHATLGRTTRDKDGNIVKETKAKFEFADDGGCVAIGPLDPDTNMPQSVAGLFGDWDAAGYMAMVLELLKPCRPVNIPDFAAIIQAAIKDGVDVCDYCQGLNCSDRMHAKKMSRKRFVKKLMGYCVSRNKANAVAAIARERGDSYAWAYMVIGFNVITIWEESLGLKSKEE